MASAVLVSIYQSTGELLGTEKLRANADKRECGISEKKIGTVTSRCVIQKPGQSSLIIPESPTAF